MPSITAYGDGYRCQVYIKGVRDSKTFERKRDAQQWGAQREQELRTTTTMGGKTFAEAALRYKTEVSTKKEGAAWEVLRLDRMMEYFGGMRLIDIKAPQIGVWRDARLEGDDDHRAVTGSTVVETNCAKRDMWVPLTFGASETPSEYVATVCWSTPLETIWTG